MSTDRPEKIPDGVVYQEISAMLNGDKLSALPQFGYRFYVVERDNGVRHILEEVEQTTGVVKEVCMDRIVSCLLSYIERYLPSKKIYRFDVDKSIKCIRYWMRTTTPIAIPLPVAELSDSRLCFSRLPFDAKIDPDKAPLFSEFLSRCSNARALEVFLGSLFFEWSQRQQYVYMYGGGQNGKSSIVRLFAKMFGRSFAAEDATKADSRFWTHGFVDKRLVVFPDCANPTFPTSGVFKSLTGDDPVRVEPKGLPSYTTALTAKFMFLSNHQLEISSMSADTRRAIYVAVGPLAGKTEGDYEDRLWREAPWIMGNCKKAFEDYTGIHGNTLIETVKDEIELLAQQHEEEFEHFFQKYFERQIIYGVDSGVPGFHVQQCFKEEKIHNPRNQAKILAYMNRKHGVVKTRTKTCYVYQGMRAKNFTEIQDIMKTTSVKIDKEYLVDSVQKPAYKSVIKLGEKNGETVFAFEGLE